MKKISRVISLLFALIMMLTSVAACGESEAIELIETPPPQSPTATVDEIETQPPQSPAATVDEVEEYSYTQQIRDKTIFQNIITCYCGRHDIDRISTAPLNMYFISDWSIQHDTQGAKLLDYANLFSNVHELTYLQWEGAPYDTLLFWSDEAIYNISIVALSISDEEVDWQNVVFYTSELIGYFEELNPTDIIVLNVAFSHYIRPHGGIIFTNHAGEVKRLFFHGWDPLEICENHFNLRVFNETHPYWEFWTWS